MTEALAFAAGLVVGFVVYSLGQRSRLKENEARLENLVDVTNDVIEKSELRREDLCRLEKEMEDDKLIKFQLTPGLTREQFTYNFLKLSIGGFVDQFQFDDGVSTQTGVISLVMRFKDEG